MIGVEIAGGRELIDEGQRCLRPIHHSNRHSPIQRDDWRRLYAFENIIEPDDLRPVCLFRARRLTMESHNCGLQREGARTTTKGLLDKRKRLRDFPSIPPGSIL